MAAMIPAGVAPPFNGLYGPRFVTPRFSCVTEDLLSPDVDGYAMPFRGLTISHQMPTPTKIPPMATADSPTSRNGTHPQLHIKHP